VKALLLRLTPYPRLRDWSRALVIALAAAVFLALSGAFGSGDAPLALRLVYWVTLMLAGAGWGGVVACLFFTEEARRRRPMLLNGLVASVVMSAPFTLVVWAGSRWILGSDMPLSATPLLFGPVLLVSLAMTAVNTLVESRRERMEAAPAAPSPPKFLERLPLKLRGGELWAVEAEDHYLRLHTSKGQDLILMRLADAVAELEGLEGAQVHRSWWVAREAIVDARRGDGRATLRLKDGSEVPVSRTYARLLRERNWI
jgi:hypothetical protein